MSNEQLQLGEFKLVLARSVGVGHHIRIGSKGKCRFCDQDETTTSFRNASHAIPEFLGNRQLLLNSECDACNLHFSREVEPHLDNYTAPFRTVAGVRKKAGGTPKHKDKNIASLQFHPKDNNLLISLIHDGVLTVDEETQLVSWRVERRPFSPRAAYKALCKIAISVIENEEWLPIFKPTIDWLNRLDPSDLKLIPSIVIEALIPGYKFVGCHYRIYYRNTDKFPHALFWIGFGNHTLQIIIPTKLDFEQCEMQGEIPFVEDIRPSSAITEMGHIAHTERDFTSDELLTLPHHVFVRFGDIEEVTQLAKRQGNGVPDAGPDSPAAAPSDPTDRTP